MATLPQTFRQRRVFIDSSAYLAFLDRDDDHHSEVVEVLHRLAALRYRQITTNIVIIETHALLIARMGADVARQFLQDIDSSRTTIVRARAADETAAKQIIFDQRDKAYSFTDAISFVVIDRLAISYALSFDRHFRQRGLVTVGKDYPLA